VNIFLGLGCMLLFGVVKKNAILARSIILRLRSRAWNVMDAIIQGNRDRLRPILMTTIALVAGMTPLVLSSGPGAGNQQIDWRAGDCGQSLCLLLTCWRAGVLSLSMITRATSGPHRLDVLRRLWARAAASGDGSGFIVGDILKQ